MTTAATATQHTVTRLDIPTSLPFDKFCDAFESLAPLFDSAVIEAITARGGSWDDVRAAVATNAPHGLMIFASIDAAPLMAAAGHTTRATEYLIGNHVVAEQMFRYNPLALLYAPLRVLVHSHNHGEAIFSLDQPSTLFASLGDPRITLVGDELDRKVIDLLALIGVDAAAAFVSCAP
ncbi:hypothetical protein BH11ACT6_BH11ACT6_12680 [soil metagenome]